MSFDKFLRIFVGFFLGAYVARYLGPDNFGIINLALAYVTVVGTVSSLGLKNVVVQKLIISPKSKYDILGSSFILQFTSSIICYLILLIYINSNDEMNLLKKNVFTIISITLLFRFSEIVIYWFESQILSKYTVMAVNASFVIVVSTKIYFLIFNYPVVYFAYTILMESILNAIFLFTVIHFSGLSIIRLKFNFNQCKSILCSSLPLMFSSLAIVIYMKIDQIMLGGMLNNQSVGIYAAASKISETWYFFGTIIVATYFPLILKNKIVDECTYFGQLQSLFNVLSVLSISISFVVAFLSPYLINLLFGINYTEAIPVLIVHIWTCVFVFLGVASARSLIAFNLQRIILYRTILNMVINIVLNYFLIPIYGPLGAAIALLITQSMGFIYDLFHEHTRQILKMKIKSLNIFHNIYNKSFP